MKEELIKEIEKKIQKVEHVKSNVVLHLKDGEAMLTNDDKLRMVISLEGKLVGYKLYHVAHPRNVFLSDNDLYSDEETIISTLKETLYVLDEYLAGRIQCALDDVRTWYGKNKKSIYLKMQLPNGKYISEKLPSINIVDFGF